MDKSNIIRLYPEPTKKPERKITPVAWVQKLIREYKNKQDELRRKKIDYLVEQTYYYYITIKIANMENSDAVDFHPSLYAAGIVVDSKCQSLALQSVIDNVLIYGARRIDECFSKAVKQFKKTGTYKDLAAKLTGGNYGK